MCHACYAFFRSLLLLGGATIANLYFGQVFRRRPGLRTPLQAIGLLLPADCLRAVAVATPAQPVLRWEPRRSPRARIHSVQHYPSRRLRSLLIALLGFSSLPQCVWAVPHGARELGLAHSLLGEHLDAAHVRPAELDTDNPAAPTAPPLVDIPCPHNAVLPRDTSVWLGGNCPGSALSIGCLWSASRQEYRP